MLTCKLQTLPKRKWWTNLQIWNKVAAAGCPLNTHIMCIFLLKKISLDEMGKLKEMFRSPPEETTILKQGEPWWSGEVNWLKLEITIKGHHGTTWHSQELQSNYAIHREVKETLSLSHLKGFYKFWYISSRFRWIHFCSLLFRNALQELFCPCIEEVHQSKWLE